MTNMGTTGREREISWFCKRYENSNRREKGELLSEIETRFLVSRRHAKRLMIGDLCSEAERKTKTGKIGRPSKYQDKAFLDALRFMWKTTRFMCSRHLKSAMPAWLPYVEMEHECFLPEVREKLLTVSAPTIDRLLKRYRAKRGKSFTRPGVFREEIPIQENIWDINVPGFLESDTVAHCGGSLAGEFVYSLTLVDIATLWTETRAVFGKGSTNIVNAIEDIERRLPFMILGYDSDNGTEVLNQHVLRYFRDERTERGLPVVQVTRAREYHKNDNAHVEQRNDSVPRKYLGYERLDFAEVLPLINHYYIDVVCPLINHFFPTFKLKGKQIIKARKKRFYDAPVTPYARVMASCHVSEDRKFRLKQIHDNLNPITLTKLEFKLRHQIDRALKLLRQGKNVSNLIIAPSDAPPSVVTHKPLRRAINGPFSGHVDNYSQPDLSDNHSKSQHNTFSDMNYEP